MCFNTACDCHNSDDSSSTSSSHTDRSGLEYKLISWPTAPEEDRR